jgi:rfaE bifunctional protein kinase chain/domain
MKRGQIDALIIEDYAKGTLSKTMAQQAVACATAHGIPVALDPHPANHLDLSGLTLMTPNRAEAFVLAGKYMTHSVLPISNDAPLLDVVAHLRETWQVEYLLVTLGGEGMALFQSEGEALHVPTQAREVFDVSGAGDTVISSFMLSLLADASPQDAALLANHAAGVVVGKVGTAPVTADELRESFEHVPGV